MIRLERLVACLPADFAAMRAEAGAEGFGMLDVPASEWATGRTRFDRRQRLQKASPSLGHPHFSSSGICGLSSKVFRAL
jgi:hypothetical protein